MKEKILSLSIIVVLALTMIVGCSSKIKSNENEETNETETPIEKEEKVVKLRFMGYNSESSRATYLKLLDEKLPNIEVTYEFVALDNFNNVLNSQLAAGQGPDIIETGAETKLLANAGYLLDLTDQEFVEKYALSGLASYTVDGKVYGTPLQSWYEGIFYNKKIFKENAIEIPNSLDKFIQIHKELQAKGIKAQTMGAQSWEPMMKQSMAIVLNEFYEKPENKDFDTKLNKGEVELAGNWTPYVKEWSKVISEGCLTPDMLGLSYDQALEEFATEKAAMWESGPWAVNAIKEKNPNLDFGMFPIPGIEEGTGWLIGGPGSALVINKKSKYTNEALQVLELTATEEAQKALIKDNAGSSFVKGVEVDLGTIYDDCQEAFKAGNVYAPFLQWSAGQSVINGYGKSLQEVLAGTKTIEKAIADADEIINSMRESLVD